MTIFINPGSGPVADATEQNAVANVRQFVGDLATDASVSDTDPVDCGDGRWRFLVTVNGNEHEVEMPGLTLDRVRWLGEASGNIWDFPRLYIDGSSWIWAFALNAVTDSPDGDT